MSDTTTGGSAFPLFAATGYAGMTLRDYFAAKAMAAIILRQGKGHLVIREITFTAYQYADDMLEARNE